MVLPSRGANSFKKRCGRMVGLLIAFTGSEIYECTIAIQYLSFTTPPNLIISSSQIVPRARLL